MATRIDSVQDRRGARRKYPWDTWTDGSAWRIVRGEDFEVPALSMRSILGQWAARHGLALSASVEGDAVEFQFSSQDRAA